MAGWAPRSVMASWNARVSRARPRHSCRSRLQRGSGRAARSAQTHRRHGALPPAHSNRLPAPAIYRQPASPAFVHRRQNRLGARCDVLATLRAGVPRARARDLCALDQQEQWPSWDPGYGMFMIRVLAAGSRAEVGSLGRGPKAAAGSRRNRSPAGARRRAAPSSSRRSR